MSARKSIDIKPPRPAEAAAPEEKKVAQANARRAMLSRLIAVPEFSSFLEMAMDDLCGYTFGEQELSPFTQGIRATMSHLLNIVAEADGSEDFIAALYRRHILNTKRKQK